MSDLTASNHKTIKEVAMKKKCLVWLAFGVMMFGVVRVSNATTLISDINMDNSYELYLSTNDNVQGELIASGYDPNYYWSRTANNPMTLDKGQDYFIHIRGIDTGGAAAFLGSFSLSGTDHQFANSSITLLTNNKDWQASSSGWGNYTTPTTWGNNGVSPWGYIPSIAGDATWIWAGDNSNNDVAYFSTKISATPSPNPEPATLLLMGTGLAGFIGARRKKK
jgi:MSHA biogenesis protein MshQ